MPVREWTRVTAGTFHHFHNAWITELCNVLNGGVLPEDYYALGEQRSGDVSPDVLTLHADTVPPSWTSPTLASRDRAAKRTEPLTRMVCMLGKALKNHDMRHL